MTGENDNPTINPHSFYQKNEDDIRPRIIVERKRTDVDVATNIITLISSILVIAAAIKYLFS